MKRGRKLKYPFNEMTVGGEPMVVDALKSASIVSCAINWAVGQKNGWKFKSQRDGSTIKLFRVK